MEKAFLIYPENCIGCRACQVACKQWNQLPAEVTANYGTYENPPKLSFITYTKIKYTEKKNSSGIQWLFLKEQCLHCREATCMLVCPVPEAIIRTKEGAVVLNRDKCIGCKHCVNACPFHIPQFDPVTGKVSKCHFCHTRIAEGMEPACSQICPTGAIKFGDRDALLRQAKNAGYQSIYGEKECRGLNVMYAIKVAPKQYGLPEDPHVPKAALFGWLRICKPLLGLGSGIAIIAAILDFFNRKNNSKEKTTTD